MLGCGGGYKRAILLVEGCPQVGGWIGSQLLPYCLRKGCLVEGEVSFSGIG